VPGGTYTLLSADNATDGPNGLPVITSPITINGGAGGSTITRDASAPDFRLFRVAAGGSLTLSDLTLTNGNSGEGFSGGIISNSGTLTLHHVTLSGGYADGNGGAIYNDGTLVIDGGSVLSGNVALDLSLKLPCCFPGMGHAMTASPERNTSGWPAARRTAPKAPPPSPRPSLGWGAGSARWWRCFRGRAVSFS